MNEKIRVFLIPDQETNLEAILGVSLLLHIWSNPLFLHFSNFCVRKLIWSS